MDTEEREPIKAAFQAKDRARLHEEILMLREQSERAIEAILSELGEATRFHMPII